MKQTTAPVATPAQALGTAPSKPGESPHGARVGIDWGTTHRRGYLLAPDGTCIAEHQDAEGMLSARGHFPESLQRMLVALGATDPAVPVVLSGMVGSASGWVEAPYLDLGVPLDQLRDHLVAVPFGPRTCLVVPGYVQRVGAPVDVMRGEETQLLGALSLGCGDGWFVLPGTHSKWVQLQGGSIRQFATYMTGELYALLGQHGTLAAAAGAEDDFVAEAFAAGLKEGADAALSNALFGCRARVVSGAMPARDARAYLSGLLIGAEWHDIRRRNAGALPPRVTLIGSPVLAERYGAAGRELGVEVRAIDPRDAYLQALAALRC